MLVDLTARLGAPSLHISDGCMHECMRVQTLAWIEIFVSFVVVVWFRLSHQIVWKVLSCEKVVCPSLEYSTEVHDHSHWKHRWSTWAPYAYICAYVYECAYVCVYIYIYIHTAHIYTWILRVGRPSARRDEITPSGEPLTSMCHFMLLSVVLKLPMLLCLCAPMLDNPILAFAQSVMRNPEPSEPTMHMMKRATPTRHG